MPLGGEQRLLILRLYGGVNNDFMNDRSGYVRNFSNNEKHVWKNLFRLQRDLGFSFAIV